MDDDTKDWIVSQVDRLVKALEGQPDQYAWVGTWAPIVVGLLSVAVAYYIASRGWNRASVDRQQDLNLAAEARRDERQARIQERNSERFDRMLESRMALSETLINQLWAMARTGSSKAAATEGRRFAFEASRLYSTVHVSEQAQLSVWVNELVGRFWEFRNTREYVGPRADWIDETDDSELFLANCARRLQIWAGGGIETHTLRSRFAHVRDEAGLKHQTLASQVSPWITADPDTTIDSP